MHPSNWHLVRVTFRNASQKNKIKLDPSTRWNWVELCGPRSHRGPAALWNSVIAESYFSVWLRTSCCQSSCCGAERGEGASPLCFMQMMQRWLSSMQQPMPIYKHSVCVCVCVCVCPFTAIHSDNSGEHSREETSMLPWVPSLHSLTYCQCGRQTHWNLFTLNQAEFNLWH